MKYIKKKDVFRRGSSFEIYTSAAVSKKRLSLRLIMVMMMPLLMTIIMMIMITHSYYHC